MAPNITSDRILYGYASREQMPGIVAFLATFDDFPLFVCNAVKLVNEVVNFIVGGDFVLTFEKFTKRQFRVSGASLLASCLSSSRDNVATFFVGVSWQGQ